MERWREVERCREREGERKADILSHTRKHAHTNTDAATQGTDLVAFHDMPSIAWVVAHRANTGVCKRIINAVSAARKKKREKERTNTKPMLLVVDCRGKDEQAR